MALTLSAPWVIFYRKVNALFANDPEVHVVYDEESNCLKLYVNDELKSIALTRLLPKEKTFGDVTMHICVIPANTPQYDDPMTTADLFEYAFDKNDAYSFVHEVEGIFATPMIYVVFRREVVQFFTDNLCDYYGQYSTLYQDIARDVFLTPVNVFYCTDINPATALNKPLGEWP